LARARRGAFKLADLMREGDEITAIIVASLRAAKQGRD